MTGMPIPKARGYLRSLPPQHNAALQFDPTDLSRTNVTFGRVPLFFYLLQWFTAHLISLLLHFVFSKPTRWLWQSPITFGPPPQGIGFNLGVVYLSWIAGVLLLYPLCRWFAGVKQRRKDWWLSYL